VIVRMLLVAVGAAAVVMVTTAWFTESLIYQRPLPAKEQRAGPHPPGSTKRTGRGAAVETGAERQERGVVRSAAVNVLLIAAMLLFVFLLVLGLMCAVETVTTIASDAWLWASGAEKTSPPSPRLAEPEHETPERHRGAVPHGPALAGFAPERDGPVGLAAPRYPWHPSG
jgi:hypothetical protein